MKKKVTVLTLAARLFALCSLGTMLLALTFPGEAQPKRTVRIGYLGSSSGLTGGEKDFVEELRKRGWIEGQNLVIDRRYWENRVDRLPAQVAELIRLNVDIILTNTGTAARAAKAVTTAIPIVMVSSADAVAQGLVMSLARPGGNVTGLTTISPLVAGKQIELIKEAFPKVWRVAFVRCGLGRLSGPATVGKKHWDEAQDVARVHKIHLLPVTVRGPGEIEEALRMAIRERADALLLSDCVRVPIDDIVELAAKSKLPAIYPYSHFVKKGGLCLTEQTKRNHFVAQLIL